MTSKDIVIDYSGNIYLNPGFGLVALDYSGKKMWTKELNCNTVIPLMCDGDGTIYVATCHVEFESYLPGKCWLEVYLILTIF